MKTTLRLIFFLAVIFVASANHGGNDDDDEDQGHGHPQPLCTRGAWRSIEGDCNNVNHPDWGRAGIPFVHLEGSGAVIPNLPNERVLSNHLLQTPAFKLDKDFTAPERRTGVKPDLLGRNAFFVAYSQMVSHDLGQNPLVFDFANALSNYVVKIQEPNDPLLDLSSPFNKTGIFSIKSLGDTDSNGIFFSANNASSYLDAAPIYGHRQSTTNQLRTFSGGKLKTNQNNGLDLVKQDGVSNLVPNECGSFGHDNNAAGDLRVDENIVLTALHTVWMREHNYLASQFAAQHPTWTDEQLFQKARAKIIALWQHIAFDELMPALLGRAWQRGMHSYHGYDDEVDVSTSDAFSTAAFRVVHDLVSLPVLVLFENCSHSVPPLTTGVPNQERANCIPAYFAQVGLDAVVRGSINQFAQAQDHAVVDGIRSVFLSATTRGGNLDVETSNIFRGREHRLPTFDEIRKYHTGKSLYDEHGCNPGSTQDPIRCFDLITNNRTHALVMQTYYKKVSNIDAYVGLITESYRFPYQFPPLATEMIIDQFAKVRSGDFWWYENTENGMFSQSDINAINQVSFADIVRRHVSSAVDISDDIFSVRSDCPL